MPDAAVRRPSLYETETPQIVAGYWLAVFIPVLGFVIGVVTYFKDVRHGIGIIAIALAGVALWVFLLLLFLL